MLPEIKAFYGAGHSYPVPQATSRTFWVPCCLSRATSQLLYSWVRLWVSPMYSSHTLAAFPSAYWSGSPTAATPRDRVRNTLSTDMLPPRGTGSKGLLVSLHSERKTRWAKTLLYSCVKRRVCCSASTC